MMCCVLGQDAVVILVLSFTPYTVGNLKDTFHSTSLQSLKL